MKQRGGTFLSSRDTKEKKSLNILGKFNHQVKLPYLWWARYKFIPSMDISTMSSVVFSLQKTTSRIEHYHSCTKFLIIRWHSFPLYVLPHPYCDPPPDLYFLRLFHYSFLIISLLMFVFFAMFMLISVWTAHFNQAR